LQNNPPIPRKGCFRCAEVMVIDMKSIRRTFIFIISVFSVGALFYCLLTVDGYSAVYTAAAPLFAEEVVIDSDFGEYSLADSTLNRSILFILRDKPISDLHFEFVYNFFSYLDYNTGIKYLVDDIGYAAGQLISEYLQNGNEQLLDAVFDAGSDKNVYSVSRKNYYKKLYDYNRGKFGIQKLTLFGIAPEEEGAAHVKLYIEYLLDKNSDKPVPTKISEYINCSRDDMSDYMEGLKTSIEQNKGLYRELFTIDYFDFEHVVENYFYDLSDVPAIYSQNLTAIYDDNIRGKYFLLVSDDSFADDFCASFQDVEKRIIRYSVYERDWFGSDEKIYAVNGGILKYFQKYGVFVSSLNKDDSTWEVVDERLYFIDTSQKI